MTISKLTVVDQIEVTRNGDIGVRLAKQIVDDGTVIASEWHRTIIVRDGDVAEQMGAVNAHLADHLGYPAVSSEDVDRIATVAAAAWG